MSKQDDDLQERIAIIMYSCGVSEEKATKMAIEQEKKRKEIENARQQSTGI